MKQPIRPARRPKSSAAGDVREVLSQLWSAAGQSLWRERAWLGLVPLGGGLIWFVTCRLVITELAQSAVRNAAVAHSLSDRLLRIIAFWDLPTVGTFALFVAGMALLILARPWFFERFVGATSPTSLGAIRVITCTVALLWVVWEDVPSVARLPVEARKTMGLMKVVYWLPIGFDGVVASVTALWIFRILTGFALLLAGIGWRSRVTLPIAACFYFVLGGVHRQYTHLFHTGLVPLYLLVVLSLMPCGDAWSVDRWRTGTPRPAPVYGWARFACWTVVALPYFIAGLSKLRNGGLLWWSPVNIRSIFYSDALNPYDFNFGLALRLESAPDLVFGILGLGGLLIELTYPAVLFSRRARLLLPASAVLLHLGVLAFQNFVFYDLVFLQAMFLLGDRVERKDRVETTTGIATTPSRSGPDQRRIAGLGYQTMIGGLLAIATVCWWARVEWYPLSAWSMYSGLNTSGIVTYTKVFVRLESGQRVPADLGGVIGALSDGRARDLLWMAFVDTKVNVMRAILDTSLRAFNERHYWRERAVAIEIEVWRWEFLQPSGTPARGRLVNQFRHPAAGPE
jgi:hypothetical protein